MGVTSSQYIICSMEYHGKQNVLQAGNREWVTVVETINAEGEILPLYSMGVTNTGHKFYIMRRYRNLG